MTTFEPTGGQPGTCRSCGAPIEWVRNELTGKASPFDPVQPCGACNGAGAGCKKCKGEGRLQKSHFATCPDAEKWRRTPRRAAKR